MGRTYVASRSSLLGVGGMERTMISDKWRDREAKVRFRELMEEQRIKESGGV